MLDIEGIDGVQLFEGKEINHPDLPATPSRIFFTYKDMRSRTIEFESFEEASAMYESLFQVLMPEVVEQLMAQAQAEVENGDEA